MQASQLFAPSFPALLVFSDEVMHKGRAWSDQLLIDCPNGEIRVEIMSRYPGADDDSKHIYFSMQKADELEKLRDYSDAERHYLSGIGHWNRVQRVFQEFERENQLILDAVGEGIYGVDANGMTTFINPQGERILGYRSEELAGRNMHTIIHHSHVDGSHFHVEKCPIFEAFRDGAVHTVDDDVFWGKSGKPIYVEPLHRFVIVVLLSER
jgi:PAS domain-containing protein